MQATFRSTHWKKHSYGSRRGARVARNKQAKNLPLVFGELFADTDVLSRCTPEVHIDVRNSCPIIPAEGPCSLNSLLA